MERLTVVALVIVTGGMGKVCSQDALPYGGRDGNTCQQDQTPVNGDFEQPSEVITAVQEFWLDADIEFKNDCLVTDSHAPEDECWRPLFESKDGIWKPLLPYEEALNRAYDANLTELKLRKREAELQQATEALETSRTRIQKLETDLVATQNQLAAARRQTAAQQETAQACAEALDAARKEHAKTVEQLDGLRSTIDEQAKQLVAAQKCAAEQREKAEDLAHVATAERDKHEKTLKELDRSRKTRHETAKQLTITNREASEQRRQAQKHAQAASAARRAHRKALQELECERRHHQETVAQLVAAAAATEKSEPWRFWRGFNVNGPAVEIDGNPWEGDASPPQLVCDDKAVKRTRGPLHPPTDASRAEMIHSFRWGRHAKLSMVNVPPGRYAVYAYVWEETHPTTFNIRLNKRIVERDYNSGSRGTWRRLGPWAVTPNDGRITLAADGGDANFSGIELWRRAASETEKGPK